MRRSTRPTPRKNVYSPRNSLNFTRQCTSGYASPDTYYYSRSAGFVQPIYFRQRRNQREEVYVCRSTRNNRGFADFQADMSGLSQCFQAVTVPRLRVNGRVFAVFAPRKISRKIEEESTGKAHPIEDARVQPRRQVPCSQQWLAAGQGNHSSEALWGKDDWCDWQI